jgi:predicted negative regulator of RcsB-dependent stress response
MQTQDVPGEFLFKLWPWLEANKNRLIGGVVGVIVLSGVVYFILAQRAQKEVDAGQAVTTLMVNQAANKNNTQMAAGFAQLASQYSGTEAGKRAQLEAAGASFEGGNYADAQTQFQKFLEVNPAGPLAAIAALGVAASLESQNKLDAAATAYQQVVTRYADSTCVPSAQFALGRIAEQQNKLAEAEKHYEDAAGSRLGGTVSQEAAMRAAEIKPKLAAAAPKTTAATTAPKAATAPAAMPLTTPQPAAKP